MSRALEIIGSSTADIYKVDQLTAMKWIGDIWAEIPDSITQNCWCSTGIITRCLQNGVYYVSTASNMASTTAEAEVSDIKPLPDEVLRARIGMRIQDLLNPADED